MQQIAATLSPNNIISKATMKIVVAMQVAAAIAFWFLWSWSSPIIPNPIEIWSAFGKLWFHEGLGQELIISYVVNLKALTYTLILSLGLSYLTVIPAIRPLAGMVSKLRFLGLAGLTFLFTLTIGGGEDLKIALLTFGMSVFFLTSMAEQVASIPKEKFDHARTLRMGEWRVVWEVVIVGKVDAAIEVMRQNAAIGWTMLTMVEGIVRSEGGVGALLLTQNKHFHLSEVFAIQILILAVGIFQDYCIGLAKRKICPYTSINLERR